MTLILAIKTCFKKTLSFSGRASRSEYWWFFAFFIASIYLASFVDSLIIGQGKVVVGPVYFLTTIALMIPWFSVTCRRLHDSNLSGIWQALILTGLGFFILWALCLRKSSPGPNDFGNPFPLGSAKESLPCVPDHESNQKALQ